MSEIEATSTMNLFGIMFEVDFSPVVGIVANAVTKSVEDHARDTKIDFMAGSREVCT